MMTQCRLQLSLRDEDDKQPWENDSPWLACSLLREEAPPRQAGTSPAKRGNAGPWSTGNISKGVCAFWQLYRLKSLVVGSVLIEMLITHAWEGACLPFALQVNEESGHDQEGPGSELRGSLEALSSWKLEKKNTMQCYPYKMSSALPGLYLVMSMLFTTSGKGVQEKCRELAKVQVMEELGVDIR
ncbi:Neurobeachin-Like Protein 1 [Manis pentadactyla]|nr:Neurobeachin-Like Protein 1 [Manis pentadactyla]